MPDPSRIVWGVGTPRTVRPHWTLCELGLDYETRAIIPRTPGMDDPEFRARSPRGKVPAYEQDEMVMGESGAISVWLADRNRDRVRLTPEPGTAARAQHDDLCSFVLMELDATALYVLRRHEGLPETYGSAPIAAQAAREYFSRGVGELERLLGDGRPALCGADLQIADILAVSCLDWARFVGIDVPAPVSAYRDRVAARPAYAAAAARNYPPEAIAALRPGSAAG